MKEAAPSPVHHEMGCGLIGAIFHRHVGSKERSVPPLPPNTNKKAGKLPNTQNISRRQQGGSCDARINLDKPNPIKNSSMVALSSSLSNSIHQHKHSRRNSDPARSTPPSTKDFSSINVSQVVNLAYTRRLRKEPTFKSGELSLTASSQYHTPDSRYRASSNNVKLPSRLGNLKQPRTKNHKRRDNQPRTEKAEVDTTFITGNILKKPVKESPQLGNIYSCVMNKLDPEVLKNMGNESYKKGRFEEALALYDQAIGLDPSKASFYSNKSAALMSLDRLIEAASECRKAIQIDPSYHNAHYRLARLYHRLGEAEKALCHYKCSGSKAGVKDIAEAEALKTHHSKCTSAQNLKDWKTLLMESRSILSLGADSAQKIYAMQAEALLNLHRHGEAYITIHKGPNFEIGQSTWFFGSGDTTYMLIIRAQVYMAFGRFEEAVTVAQHAARVDSSREIETVVKRAQVLSSARSNGNQLFKESKFSKACLMYTEGLEQEPYNSVLLCNRAACRHKLGQFEKAVEDCTIALNVRPSYSKARLRRANCNAKLERWEAAIQDYEILLQETPGNEEVSGALIDARIKVKKSRTEMKSTIKIRS